MLIEVETVNLAKNRGEIDFVCEMVVFEGADASDLCGVLKMFLAFPESVLGFAARCGFAFPAFQLASQRQVKQAAGHGDECPAFVNLKPFPDGRIWNEQMQD